MNVNVLPENLTRTEYLFEKIILIQDNADEIITK